MWNTKRFLFPPHVFDIGSRCDICEWQPIFGMISRGIILITVEHAHKKTG